MLGRQTINEKRSAKANLVATLLMVGVAALFVMAFTGGGQPFTLQGQVVAVDPSVSTLIVKSLEDNSLAIMGSEYTFNLSQLSGASMCGEDKSIADINAGDMVTVWYHQESNGGILADSVDFTSPYMKC